MESRKIDADMRREENEQAAHRHELIMERANETNLRLQIQLRMMQQESKSERAMLE